MANEIENVLSLTDLIVQLSWMDGWMESSKKWKHSRDRKRRNGRKGVIFLELINIVNQFCLLVTIEKHCLLILESLITQLSIVKSLSLYYNFHHQYVIFLQFSGMYVNFQGPMIYIAVIFYYLTCKWMYI